MDAFACLALSATLVAGTNDRLSQIEPYVAGDVRISESGGTTIEGALASIQDGKLAVLTQSGTQTIALDGVTKIERRGDSLKTGFIAGAITGIVLGAIACPECGGGWRLYETVVSATMFGFAGAGIDAMYTGWTTVYERKLNAARSGPNATFASVRFRF
jgi:hypothetical protein